MSPMGAISESPAPAPFVLEEQKPFPIKLVLGQGPRSIGGIEVLNRVAEPDDGLTPLPVLELRDNSAGRCKANQRAGVLDHPVDAPIAIREVDVGHPFQLPHHASTMRDERAGPVSGDLVVLVERPEQEQSRCTQCPVLTIRQPSKTLPSELDNNGPVGGQLASPGRLPVKPMRFEAEG